MTKSGRLTKERLVSLANETGWSVQTNGSVLRPIYGATTTLSADGHRAYLNLRSGVRVFLDTEGYGQVQPPPEASVDGVRLISFKRADLRDLSVMQDAAALIRELGEEEGVLVLQGGYRHSVGVRPGGVTVVLEKVRPHATRTVRFLKDSQPSGQTRSALTLVQMLLAACTPLL